MNEPKETPTTQRKPNLIIEISLFGTQFKTSYLYQSVIFDVKKNTFKVFRGRTISEALIDTAKYIEENERDVDETNSNIEKSEECRFCHMTHYMKLLIRDIYKDR